jgi:N-acetylglucosamine-6-phosphate deacetylase
MKFARLLSALFTAACLLVAGLAIAAPRTTPSPGLRESSHDVHALVGAKIVVSPELTIEKGTLVIRDGVITAVGDKVESPADARVWDMSGKTLYPGLIDAYGELSTETSRGGVKDGAGAGYWNANVVPHVHAGELYAADAAANKKLRGQGITARLVAPSAGIIKGTSILVSTGDGAGQQVILKDPVALHLKLTTSRGAGGYPNSPMGAYTLVRQAFYDAGWYGQAWEAYQAHPELERPERSAALAALGTYLGRTGPVIVDATDELYLLRADRIGDEFNLNVIVRGSGHEYRRLNEVKATGRAVIVPLDFPKPPNVATPEAAMNVELERLMHWDLAPENPARLVAAGVKIAFTSQGLRDTGTFLAAVRKAVKRGLDGKAALAALTVTPAELYGAKDRLGTLEVGKAANLVVADGELFAEKTKVLESWTDGERHEIVNEPEADIRGTWAVEATKPDGAKETWTVEITGRPTKLAGKISRGDKSAKLISAELSQLQFTASFKGEPLNYEGIVQSSATISASDKNKPESEFAWLGAIVWADGKRTESTGKRTAGPKAEEEVKDEKGDAKDAEDKDEKKDDSDDKPDADKKEDQDAKEEGDKKEDGDKPKEPKDLGPSISPINFPLGAFGRPAQPDQPRFVLFKGATVWTSGPQGRLEKADVLVESGKIKAVGENLTASEGAVTIDVHGKHLSPGIIDCHSHIATDGGVNESAQTITAEVRIGDFVDPNDINIYRQLAGGVTASNILHGSANTIGGQNQVLKFRWGAGPEEMKFAAAAPGIKFALGENVKQSNWGARNTSRYPQSRMGVEQLVRDAFEAAKQYRRTWDEWNRTKVGLPPRIDLELEALAEVVEGKRFIHCHSYRGDEILALIRTCDAFGVKIATFQHVLEGYKVADAIAKHGAGGSSFSDWWAYKFEVFDAIPYNGALLHNAGVVVSFNSDNAELARRLNLEAAKAIKYGGVSPEEALKFVTLNPARQLKVDEHVGSIEAGKDADLVIWSGSPLSTFSRCEQTWVDGRRYFDLTEDKELRKQAADLRAKLVQRVLASGEPAAGAGEKEGDRWPREDLFCGHHDHGDHGHQHEQHDESGHEHE